MGDFVLFLWRHLHLCLIKLVKHDLSLLNSHFRVVRAKVDRVQHTGSEVALVACKNKVEGAGWVEE